MRPDEKYIEEEVEKTLAVAGKISGVPANPYLWTRIEAEINQQPVRSFLYQVRWQLAAVTGIILLNGVFLGLDLNKASKAAELTAVQEIWQDYSQDWNTEVFVPQNEESS